MWKILERLDDEDEHSWVRSIVNELYKGLGMIQNHPKAMDMLVNALCLKGVPDHAVASHSQVRCAICRMDCNLLLHVDNCALPQRPHL